MQDLIDRQAAIELLSQYPFEDVVNCISILEEMPSVDAVQVIRCKDCAKFKGAYGKEYRDGDGYGYCSGEGPVNGTPCDGYCNEAVRKGEEWMI